MKRRLGLLLLFGFTFLLAAEYPYYYKWKELSGRRVCVIFPNFARSEAERFYTLAEEILPQLEVYWQQKFNDKIYIVLEASRDDSNGSATIYPLNLVTISLPAPQLYSSIGNFFSWPCSVLVHELSHLFQLNLDNPFNVALRRVFGRFPLFFPAVNLPLWVIEGAAILAESELADGGRLASADFEQILRAAAASDCFLNWKEASGNILRWPAGAAPYIYGSKFLQFLEQNDGRSKFHFFLKEMTEFAVTSISNSFQQVYRQSIDNYWKKFRDKYKLDEVIFNSSFVRLTTDGNVKSFPKFFDRETVICLHEDFQSLTKVIGFNLEKGSRQKLFSFPAISNLTVQNGKILFSAFDFDSQQNYFSQIYVWSEKLRQAKLFDRGKRLFSPFFFSGRVFAIAQNVGQQMVVELSSPDKKAIFQAELIGDPAVFFDGSRLALVVKEKNSAAEILIFDNFWNLLDRIAIPGVNLYNPCWVNEQQLLFIARIQKQNRILRYSFETKTIEEFEQNDFSPIQFDYSADRQLIVFSFYSENGVDLALLDVSVLNFKPLEMLSEKQDAGLQTPNLFSEISIPKEKNYQIGRQFFPVFWLPYLNLNSFDPGVGFFTLHQDLLKILNYQLYFWQGLKSKRSNVDFALFLNLIYPRIQFRVQRDYQLEAQRDYFQIRLGLDFPLINSLRKKAILSLACGFESDKQIDFHNQGVFSGWEFTFRNFKLFPFGFSRSDGLELRFFSRYNGFNFQKYFWGAEVKSYLSLFRPNVFAFRLAFVGSNDRRSVIFGGSGQNILFEEEKNDNQQLLNVFRYLRGNELRGKMGWQLNLEYRCALLKIERVDIFGVYLQRVLFVPFLDCGAIRTYSGHDSFRSACGAELQFLFSSSGYQLKVASGVAFSLSQDGQPKFYLRLGSSF